MKRFLLMIVVLMGFVSLAWGDPPVRKVEVVNDPLNVDIINQPVGVNVINWPETQDVNIVQTPLDVRVVNDSTPVQYEYYVFEGEAEQMLNVLNLLKPGQNEYWTIPDLLNQKATEGFELNFFTVTPGHSWPQHYIVIMRRPVP